MTSPPPLLFGIYPLGVAGTPTGLAVGPPDDYDQIRAALNDLGLQGSTRTYLVSTETGGEDAVLRLADRCRPSTWTYVVGTAKSLLGASPDRGHGHAHQPRLRVSAGHSVSSPNGRLS